MRLRSRDVESFARLNHLKRDFRATYIIEIDREKVHCTLKAINSLIDKHNKIVKEYEALINAGIDVTEKQKMLIRIYLQNEKDKLLIIN